MPPAAEWMQVILRTIHQMVVIRFHNDVNSKEPWGFKKKRTDIALKPQGSLFFINAQTESPSVRLNYFLLLGNAKWPVLQGRPASSCTYHTVKSHPVPGRHVTFKNATVNDSTVHDGLLNEKEDILYTLLFCYHLFSKATPWASCASARLITAFFRLGLS